MSEVTRILAAIDEGDARASSVLLPIVYEELRRLAGQKLARERRQTLQPTDLVHEAYLRLVGPAGKTSEPHGGKRSGWDNRGHFFAAAAEAMRRILIDRARSRQRVKRGGDRQKVPLDEVLLSIEESPDDLIALDEALTRFVAEDPVKANLVKLRYFAGLKIEEAAALMGISRATADRYWAFARAWLYHEITKDDATTP